MRRVVTAPAGPILGTVDRGVARYLGIPYAEAPVGIRRFAAPVRRAPFAEPFPALAYGATPQRVPLFATTTIPEPSLPGEDILNLNVFAPADGESCPVLVWIHGGGYVAGSAASPWYDGSTFAREDGIVVVSVSYRLGLDGFGVIDGAPSNLGLRDLLAALHWVQENIEAFGGDPSRVTVAGQSAGGGAALALLSSPLGEGLFSGCVSVSGTDTTFPVAQGAASTAALAELLGVPATREGLSAVSDVEAQLALLRLRDSSVDALLFGPVHGDDALPDDIVAGVSRRSPAVAVLLGSTSDEFDGGPTAENPDRPVLDAAAHAASRASGSRVTDTLFRAVCPRIARARPGGSASWLYSFEWASPVTQGSTHCIDVPFFFGNLDQPGVPEALGPVPPRSLQSTMHSDLARFVRTGRVDWPEASGSEEDIVRRYGPDGSDEVRDEVGAYLPVLKWVEA